MNKIKALWLASWYPSKENPSIGDFIQRQAIATASLVDIKVLCFVTSTSVQNVEVSSITHASGLEEIIVYYPSSEGKVLGKLWKKYYFLRALVSGLKEVHERGWKPDLLHLYILFPLAWVALFYQRWSRVPLIVSEQATHYALGYLHPSRLTKVIGKTVTNISKTIVVVCKSLGEAMQSSGYNGTFRIIPNVVDFAPISRQVESKFSKGKIFRWIHASTLAPGHKNIEGLLCVVKRLVDADYSFQLTLIGGSKRLNQIYAENSKSLGLENIVFFLDELPHSEALSMIAQYDAMVHFSNCETFGLSVLEALRIGLPVIATDTGVFSEWIDERSGVIVPIKDEQALYDGMIKMMNNIEQYDTAHLISRMDCTLNAATVGKFIHDLYTETMESYSK